MLQQLIDILKHIGFKIEDIPDTVYLLLKCDEFVLDCLKLYEYTFEGTEDVVSYYRPKDIVEIRVEQQVSYARYSIGVIELQLTYVN